MTDTSHLIPNQKGITSDLLFNMKASSVPARSYRASIPTTNATTFAPGSVAISYIPGGRRNTFLDTTQSYVRFTVQNNSAANNFNVDQCGAGFINRLDVFHGSNALESIQQYNVLFNAITDIQCNQSQKYGLQNSFGFGTNSSSFRNGAQVGSGNCRQTFCLPILSGVVGVGLDKMLPLHSLNDDIRLEWTFEASDVAVCWTTASSTAWSIINFELELCIVELSDEGMSMINSVSPLNQTLYLHGNSWRHYVSTLAANSSGNYSTLVPARFASLKSLWLAPRRSTEMTSATSYSLCSRANPNFATYWWRIGSALVPQKPVNLSNANTTGGYAEGYSELQRAMHSLGRFENASSLSYSFYCTADTADASGNVSAIVAGGTSYSNGFLIIQECESYANRSDVVLSGMNTLSSQVFFESNINTAIAGNSYTLDFYSNYDHILVIDQGLISVKF